jgi:hypothetical protein
MLSNCHGPADFISAIRGCDRGKAQDIRPQMAAEMSRGRWQTGGSERKAVHLLRSIQANP